MNSKRTPGTIIPRITIPTVEKTPEPSRALKLLVSSIVIVRITASRKDPRALTGAETFMEAAGG